MDTISLKKNSPNYPSALQQHLGKDPPDKITAIGNLDILRHKSTAFFCSTKCPGDLIVKTYDIAQILRDAGMTVISGFHSPMERECLTILLRGTQPVIICPARSINNP
jgi:predicted Rossmann fold nucleotide-binding protein DprA/Smf involved in DNA uptake